MVTKNGLTVWALGAVGVEDVPLPEVDGCVSIHTPPFDLTKPLLHVHALLPCTELALSGHCAHEAAAGVDAILPASQAAQRVPDSMSARVEVWPGVHSEQGAPSCPEYPALHMHCISALLPDCECVC